VSLGLEELNDAALLIVGHGRSNSPVSTALIQGHASAISDRHIFKEVYSGFIKLAPFMDAQLAEIENDTVHIVPCFASPGSLTKTAIPERLGLKGNITQRGNQTLYYCEPVGNHPMVTQQICNIVEKTVRTSGVPADDTTIIVVGHGSGQNPQSEIDTRHLADQLDQLALSEKVIALFLDQAPNLTDWLSHCTTTHAIIVGYLFSGGSHETVDVPKLLGINPSLTKDRLANDQAIGPIEIESRQLWLSPPIGADKVVQDVIIERALEILAE
jgi:sirohydrochlorin cobaltochelatase